MSLTPSPQGDDPIITQFKPVQGQRELNGDNIKRIDPKTGRTILHNYCEHINTTPLEVYRYLIETVGCDINALDKYKYTPLHHALNNFHPNDGDDATVLMYLFGQRCVNVNIKDEYGHTLFHLACINISTLPLDVFKLLIEMHGADVNNQFKLTDTPIHHALHGFDPNKGGNIAVLMYLLTQGDINANLKGRFGCTLLHTACKKINKLPIDVFKVLIETHGTDINVLSNSKDTPIHYALRCFKRDNGGDIDVLAGLINQKGVNSNVKNRGGSTLLHTACNNINSLPLDIFKLLIEIMGCDVNAQDNYNVTPLHSALVCFDPNKGGDITVLTYLLSQKTVNVSIKGKNGHNLLHWACNNDRSDPTGLNAKTDTVLCQIVECIIKRSVQQILDETMS
jgi:ankyrin repeat protein